MATVIAVEELTNGSVVNNEWIGTGVFDKLMAAVSGNIETQYQKGRITGSDYANVYTAAMQAVLAQSVQWALNADTNAAQTDDILTTTQIKLRDIAEKEATGIKQRLVMDAQKDLYVRQTQGFDDNKYQKLLESQMNYNSMIFADASNPSVLGIALENRVNDVYNKIVGNNPVNMAPE